jgi:hypothetical protein
MHEMMKDADLAREELVARITHGLYRNVCEKSLTCMLVSVTMEKQGGKALKTEIIDKWVENLGHCSGAISRSPIC